MHTKIGDFEGILRCRNGSVQDVKISSCNVSFLCLRPRDSCMDFLSLPKICNFGKIFDFCQSSIYLCRTMNDLDGLITGFAEKEGNFSVAQLGGYLQSIQCDVPTASLYYCLNRMIKQKKLTRMTRGIYSTTFGKLEFRASITGEMREIYDYLHKALPFADFCLYTGNDLTPFQHNMAANNILYVETQRDTCNSAFNILKDAGKTAYLRPDKDMITRYISMAEPSVFVKPLTSESPVVKEDDGMMIPTLEKLLVDVNTDKDYFYLQGEEAFFMFRNATERYSINEKRLLRYARRRSIEPAIMKYLEEAI